MKLLITAGGCAEPIDSVRALTNTSTGRTGAFLADYFHRRGAAVTLLKQDRAINLEEPVSLRLYDGFAGLAKLLEEELSGQDYDAVIHAAAVSDFSVASVRIGSETFPAPLSRKLESGASGATGEEISLRLKKNPKLLSRLAGFSRNPGLCVIGFKLTDSPLLEEREEAVGRLFRESACTAVVHNDRSEISPERHLFRLYTAPPASTRSTRSAEEARPNKEASQAMPPRTPEILRGAGALADCLERFLKSRLSSENTRQDRTEE